MLRLLRLESSAAPQQIRSRASAEETTMSGLTEVSVDSQGCIRIPAEIQDRMGLAAGMTLVVEEREDGEMCLRVHRETPELVDKEGVLVVKTEAVGDLTNAVGQDRDRRLSELIERAGL
jgi:AbrB family looped-hinge helix DNA binding protein